MPLPAAPGVPSPAMPPAGPAAAPMTLPAPNDGKIAAAKIKVNLAVQVLERALLDVGSMSPDGKHLLQAIKTLEKVGGPTKGGDLNGAAIKELQASVGPDNAGGPPPGAPPMPPGGGMPMTGPSPMGI